MATRKSKSGRRTSSRRGSRGSTSRRRSRRRYGPKAQQKVERTLHEMKRGRLRSGRSGRRVKSREQAIAIGLSRARREGGKVPSRRGGSRRGTRRSGSSQKRSGRRASANR